MPDRRLPILLKDGLDGSYTGSFAVSLEKQEKKPSVDLRINQRAFTTIDLPDLVDRQQAKE